MTRNYDTGSHTYICTVCNVANCVSCSVPAFPNACTTCSPGYQLDGGSCYGCGLSKCT